MPRKVRRIRTIHVHRQMTALQVNNAIREALKSVSKLKSFSVLEADAGCRLVHAGSQTLNGVGAIERHGSLYLSEDDETQSAASQSEEKDEEHPLDSGDSDGLRRSIPNENCEGRQSATRAQKTFASR